MQILLYFAIVLGGLVALILIISALMPATYSISQDTTIQASPKKVQDHIADLNHYRDWNPWQQMEPGSKQQIEGTPHTIGHSYSWEGKKIGAGQLTLQSITPGNEVKFKLEFFKPWKSVASDEWKFEGDEKSCKVTWSNNGPLAWPMARLMGPMIVKQLNTQFAVGLKNLKTLCEK